MKQAIDRPLSDEDYAELDVLLAAPELDGRAMSVSMLEGLLTAVVSGPKLVPAQWLPWVWDRVDGETDGSSVSAGHTERAVELIMRHHAHMATWLREDPASFEPIFHCGAEWDATAWCEGFLIGMELDMPTWTALFVSEPSWFAPFMRLGTDEGLALTKDDAETEHWRNEVAPAVIKIKAFWAARQQSSKLPLVRATVKVGRNDPCPCGSGKKHKKCCGTDS